jgi:hypothetical protein
LENEKMKAIRVHEFGGPEVLKLEEVPTPKPSAGEVLVRIHAAGVNPYDTYMRAGTYAVKPTLPKQRIGSTDDCGFSPIMELASTPPPSNCSSDLRGKARAQGQDRHALGA